jgi:hypothetical protein
MPLPHFPRKRTLPYLLNWWLGGSQSRSGCFGKRQCLTPSGNRTSCSAHTVVTVSTVSHTSLYLCIFPRWVYCASFESSNCVSVAPHSQVHASAMLLPLIVGNCKVRYVSAYSTVTFMPCFITLIQTLRWTRLRTHAPTIMEISEANVCMFFYGT